MKHIISIYIFFVICCNYLYSQITYTSAFPNINFEFPVEIQNANDNSNRLFVVEQRGRIKVFPNQSSVTSTSVKPFLDIVDRVRFSEGQETGLLGLAFHPQFTSNGYFYLYYTVDSPIAGVDVRMVLSRFSISDLNDANENDEQIIFQFDKNQRNSNHNGGKIAFGPDGYLYISIGDGGGGNDPRRNAQNTGNVFGSILRIDIDLDGNNPIETNPVLPNGNYEIPSDNPLINTSGLDEIYAYGIRNTWKFSFDKITNRLWGADVGQGAFEEINLIENGKNYGWNRFEGNSIANSGVIINESTEAPVFTYNRNQGDISITGGYVYRGTEITSLTPNINSKYIFGDYVSGRVWALDYNQTTGNASSELLFKTSNEFISSFGQDENGELYFSDYGTNSKLYKIVDGSTTPNATQANGFGQWSSLNEGIPNGTVNAIATDSNGNVYHGGSFNKAGTISANNIAVWNESSGWRSLGSGSNGTINTLVTDNNGNLYAGGSFTEMDGKTANNIAAWNGTEWKSLDTGIPGPISALAVDNNQNLYVGGIFESVNGKSARNIAYWNGNTWTTLIDNSSGVAGLNNEVRSLAYDHNESILYVGGNFDEAGNKSANRIATWNGTNWGTLGTGTSGFVEAISITDTDIYIGGNFALAGNTTVNRIARWNKVSSNWNTLDNGVNNLVSSLIHDGTNLYVGGNFNFADTTNPIVVNNIAAWNATEGWKALGTNTNVGVDTKINSLAIDQNTSSKIYAAGNFNTAGIITAKNTAEWTNTTLNIEEDSVKEKRLLYPNPTSGIIQLPLEEQWEIFSLTGKKILRGKATKVNLSKFSSGIYFLKYSSGTSIKIIKK
ncbi:PQQ-dependent sugar dehydrogenase [Tenacibaculum agarivorans]|uniref:PQQ-dependent sugar dehydrogenase n=1 Tax=Tenacibaculum agarivorans TaxID=1908389 RepID=UPI00094BBA1C|nr:PQQ-dependent sugar dehydrogenase [Tenacibaculum agarivorans]